MSEVPTLYEWAGGRPAIERMIDRFYDRVEQDDLLSPLFPGGVSAAHREHVNSRGRVAAAAMPTWPHDVHSILTIIGVLPSIPAGTKKPPVSLHQGLKVA